MDDPDGDSADAQYYIFTRRSPHAGPARDLHSYSLEPNRIHFDDWAGHDNRDSAGGSEPSVAERHRMDMRRQTCNRSNVLAGGSSFPSISATVFVAGNAPSPVLNQVTVSGGGAPSSSHNDSTIIDNAGTLDAPTLTEPSNGAINLPLTPTLKWSTVTGATSYDVWLAAAPNPVFIKNVVSPTTEYIPEPLNMDTYYSWYVVAKSSGASGPPSAIRTFMTDAPPVVHHSKNLREYIRLNGRVIAIETPAALLATCLLAGVSMAAGVSTTLAVTLSAPAPPTAAVSVSPPAILRYYPCQRVSPSHPALQAPPLPLRRER